MKETTKSILLKSAYKCFATNGYQATKTADITKNVKMSSGLLFHYFEGKRAILFSLLEKEAEESKELINELLKIKDPLRAIHIFFDYVVEAASDLYYPGFALEISALAHHDPIVSNILAANESILYEGLKKMLNKINKDTDTDVHSNIVWLLALVDGLFARLAIDKNFDPKNEAKNLHKIVDLVVQM